MMIDLGEAEILKRQVSHAFHGGVHIYRPGAYLFQQTAQMILIHTSPSVARSWGEEPALTFLRCGPLRLIAAGDFLRPKLCDAFDQLYGDWIGEREADRAFADLVRRK